MNNLLSKINTENAIEVLNNDYTLAALSILTTAYVTLGTIKLPDFVVTLFKNDVFRVVFLSLLLMFRFEKAPHVALIVALVFVITLDYISKREVAEHFTNYYVAKKQRDEFFENIKNNNY